MEYIEVVLSTLGKLCRSTPKRILANRIACSTCSLNLIVQLLCRQKEWILVRIVIASLILPLVSLVVSFEVFR